MKSRIFFCLNALLAIFLIVFIVNETYGLFETNNVMIVNPQIGKWNIFINDTSAVEETFEVNSITVADNTKVKDGKIAPGTSGYFDILIDPTDTDVSIRYDISFDFSQILDSFAIESIEEIGGLDLIQTGEFTYSNIITLEDILDDVTNTIRVYIEWINDETNNEDDSIIGMDKESYISIPISITVSQYLGEEIEEYVSVPVEE